MISFLGALHFFPYSLLNTNVKRMKLLRKHHIFLLEYVLLPCPDDQIIALRYSSLDGSMERA